MVPVTASLIGFSGEIIWPLGKLSLLVKIGDEEHSTSTWMNFVVVSRELLTLRSSKIIPIECASVSGPKGQPPAAHQAIEERIKGYHQIKMAKEDEEKTSFYYYSKEYCCYSKIYASFALRKAECWENAYQRHGLV
ncbi:hypothetical protein Tco_0725828 [Tanacetum coccineum]|uniref:Reverse transcriptase domain-containing protein n=1 Tax=Tanacetum coccineum TaxID=301880 RepID=A0ABQ4YEV5_9ASTR